MNCNIEFPTNHCVLLSIVADESASDRRWPKVSVASFGKFSACWKFCGGNKICCESVVCRYYVSRPLSSCMYMCCCRPRLKHALPVPCFMSKVSGSKTCSGMLQSPLNSLANFCPQIAEIWHWSTVCLCLCSYLMMLFWAFITSLLQLDQWPGG